MRWIRDRTGRFAQRPHYEPWELDQECEELVLTFLRQRYGEAIFPINTEDLTVLIEQYASSLDHYADLTALGEDVEGVTDFVPNCKPTVRIARSLSLDSRRENRLRTTLTHELGHVRLHTFLFDLADRQLSLLSESAETAWQCKRETILGAHEVDWMEWQAGFASGAYLMPATALRTLVEDLRRRAGAKGPVSIATSLGEELIHRTQATFQVSADAARVRLIKLAYLTEEPDSPTLFDR